MQGEPLCPAMLDCVVAACSQIGDSTRAFETFAAYGNLGLVPGAQAYNAVLQGCIYHGLVDSVPKVRPSAHKSPSFTAFLDNAVQTVCMHVDQSQNACSAGLQ